MKIRLSGHHTLTTICGIPYLLPYGQGIVDYKRQLRLNPSAAEYYKLIEAYIGSDSAAERDDVIRRLGDNEMPGDDAGDFLDTLLSAGVLREAPPEPKAPLRPAAAGAAPASMSTYFLRIGGITVALRAAVSHVADELLAFCNDLDGMADISVTIGDSPVELPQDTTLLSNYYMSLYETPDGFYIEYPGEPGIGSVSFSPVQQTAVIRPTSAADAAVSHGAFMALRLILSFLWQKKHKYLMHAASFIYHDKVWLISAKSGTGKSTHAAHWRSLWPQEITDFNGDLALIRQGNSPLVCGIPWHGTSGIYTNRDLPLGGIIMLRRSTLPLPAGATVIDRLDANTVYTLPKDETALGILQRLISPTWHEDQLLSCKTFAEDVIKRVPIYQLSADDSDSSAILMRRVIDRQ